MLQISEDGSFGKPNRLKIQDTETSGEASSDDSANARGEETREKSRRVRNDDDRRRAPSSEAGRYSTMRSEGSSESAQNDCAGSVKSTDIHESKGTQRNIITRNNQVKRKKPKRTRRKRGPRWVAYSVESNQEASQVMLVNAVRDGGVENGTTPGRSEYRDTWGRGRRHQQRVESGQKS